MNNISYHVSVSLTWAAAIDDFFAPNIYNEHVIIIFFNDHLDISVNSSRIYRVIMLPLKTKADRLIPNQVAHWFF